MFHQYSEEICHQGVTHFILASLLYLGCYNVLCYTHPSMVTF